MTLLEMLYNSVRANPGKAAIAFHESIMTYGELGALVDNLASSLYSLGLKKGDRVGVMLMRSPELVVSFLAASRARGAAMPINFELAPQDVRSIIENTSPKFIISDPAFVDSLKKALPAHSGVKVIVTGEAKGSGLLSWRDLVSAGGGLPPAPSVDDVFYLNYTSGSTGNSRGAITTHSNVYWNTAAAVKALDMGHEDVHLCMFAPFAHPHEIFARPLLLGGTMVLVDRIYPKSIAKAISDNRVTCMMGLAPLYENLLDLLGYNCEFDLGSLKVPESGGMFTRPALMDRFRQTLGVDIIPVWGSTETSGIAIANRPGREMVPGSIGRPCESYEVMIADEFGEEAAPGEVGEMAFRGPAVVNGYYEDNGGSSPSFRDGWYFSGDLGRKDREGNFYFVERKSGMMKVAGLKVFPLEIELALLDNPDIKEAAVIPVKDRSRGEVPKAIIVPRDGKALTEKDVLKHCRERIAHYKLPRIIEIRESLPKIGSGKLNKKALLLERA
ncbi:MAG: AMP-binding protein [Deltaproteobacteria bacterium]|nr:AMP-binding protein [Deltaproteobacteria bacterium]